MDNSELAKNVGFIILNLWGLKAENDTLKARIDGLLAVKPEVKSDPQ